MDDPHVYPCRRWGWCGRSGTGHLSGPDAHRLHPGLVIRLNALPAE
ncbi:hypothetical protein I553_0970 [Mycobacterium xenopi 4042]|uniref:Uncharacterized protein n=1 Tax=Mycobacterium xenopi 4042 TaxID=1299334 RepID=X7ZBM8_MYCXE|nr:hypothetical protein I553_0970 [Mycobacterium xenopi 4042]